MKTMMFGKSGFPDAESGGAADPVGERFSVKFRARIGVAARIVRALKGAADEGLNLPAQMIFFFP
jgi:hypothetical protein